MYVCVRHCPENNGLFNASWARVCINDPNTVHVPEWDTSQTEATARAWSKTRHCDLRLSCIYAQCWFIWGWNYKSLNFERNSVGQWCCSFVVWKQSRPITELWTKSKCWCSVAIMRQNRSVIQCMCNHTTCHGFSLFKARFFIIFSSKLSSLANKYTQKNKLKVTLKGSDDHGLGEVGGGLLPTNSRISCSLIQALVASSLPPSTHQPFALKRNTVTQGGAPLPFCEFVWVCDRWWADWTMGGLYRIYIHVAQIRQPCAHTQPVGDDRTK